MQKLNFPDFDFKITKENNQIKIFDVVRNKYVVLTPEEWVRQHILQLFILEKKIPKGLIAVEKEIQYNGLVKRFDILVYTRAAQPFLMVGCKAPDVETLQSVFNQVAVYNKQYVADYIMVSNGIKHFICAYNKENKCYDFIKDFPVFEV